MAAPYYKYAERDATSQVNWSDISSQIVQTLEEKRDQVVLTTAQKDKEYQDYLKNLNNVAVSDNPDFNRWTANMTSDLQDANLLLYRRLQRGEISLREYNFFRNNLNTGTDSFLGVATQIADWQKANSELLATNQMSALGIHMAARFEEFFNVTGTSAYINPQDYTMGVAGLEKDPTTGGWKVSSNPGKITSFQQLLAGMGQQYKPFDVTTEVANFVGTFGEDIRIKMRDLGVTTISDFRQKTAKDPATQEAYNVYEKALGNTLNALMENNERSAHILMTMGIFAPNGKQYEFTEDATEASKAGNEHLILITPDPRNPSSGRFTPQLSPEQRGVVKDKLTQMIESQLDYSEDYKQLQQAPAQRAESPSNEEQKTLSDIENFRKLYEGTQTDVTAAENYFKEKDPNIVSIDKTPKGLTINYRNQASVPISLVDTNGAPITFEQALATSAQLIKNPQAQAMYMMRPFQAIYNPLDVPGQRSQIRMKAPSSIAVGAPNETGEFLFRGFGLADGIAKSITATDEATAASQVVSSANMLFSKLLDEEQQVLNGMVIKAYRNEDYEERMPDDFVEINIPGITSGPIYIPMTVRYRRARANDWGNDRNNIGEIIHNIAKIYNETGKPVTFEQLSPFYMAETSDGQSAKTVYSPASVQRLMAGTAEAEETEPAAPTPAANDPLNPPAQ